MSGTGEIRFCFQVRDPEQAIFFFRLMSGAGSGIKDPSEFLCQVMAEYVHNLYEERSNDPGFPVGRPINPFFSEAQQASPGMEEGEWDLCIDLTHDMLEQLDILAARTGTDRFGVFANAMIAYEIYSKPS